MGSLQRCLDVLALFLGPHDHHIAKFNVKSQTHGFQLSSLAGAPASPTAPTQPPLAFSPKGQDVRELSPESSSLSTFSRYCDSNQILLLKSRLESRPFLGLQPRVSNCRLHLKVW